MFECLILGDSVGVGTAHAISAASAQVCEVRALEGANSRQVLRWALPDRCFGAAIISIGTNDSADNTLARNLRTIRFRLTVRRAIWLLPYGQAQSRVVRTIIGQFGDEVLDLRPFRTRDGVHPASYREVAAALLR